MKISMVNGSISPPRGIPETPPALFPVQTHDRYATPPYTRVTTCPTSKFAFPIRLDSVLIFVDRWGPEQSAPPVPSHVVAYGSVVGSVKMIWSLFATRLK